MWSESKPVKTTNRLSGGDMAVALVRRSSDMAVCVGKTERGVRGVSER